MSQTTTSSPWTCGSCQHPNAQAARFCAGCGHALYEKCGNCGGDVTLAQKFCVACGQNLVELVRERLAHHESRFVQAISNAKQFDYAKSIDILEQLIELDDFRFADLQSRARSALERVRSLQSRVSGHAAERIAAAKTAAERQDHRRVQDLLGDLPPQMLDEVSQARLDSATRQLAVASSLQADLEKSLAAKDYEMATGLVGQLLEIKPKSETLQKLATQLTDKSFRRVERKFARGDYATARESLRSLTGLEHDERYQDLSNQIELAAWLSDQFDGEPFVTPTLGRLAMRFRKERPQDERASDLVNRLSVAVNGSRSTARDGFAPWGSQRASWLGGPLGVLACPQSVELGELQDRPTSFSSFHVAIGLAWHGLGQGRFQGNLLEKKGLMSKLAFGKSTSVWGIDVGTSAIRAVRLRLDKSDDKPVVTAAVAVEVSRSAGGGNDPEPLKAAMTTLLDRVDLDGEPVWCNLADCDSVARFGVLPPVKDKEADRLLALEIKNRIPIPADDLSRMEWVAPLDKRSGAGRAMMVVAATKKIVSRRVELLQDAGLNLNGMVPEAIALATFGTLEFADILSGAAECGGTSGLPAVRASQASVDTVAIVDAGASKTLLVLVSSDFVWFWSQETGGDDITRAVARVLQQTTEQANLMKQNLASTTRPQAADEVVAEKQSTLRLRLVKLLDEAQRTFPSMQVRQTWCSGLASLQHGFHRRVLIASKERSR